MSKLIINISYKRTRRYLITVSFFPFIFKNNTGDQPETLGVKTHGSHTKTVGPEVFWVFFNTLDPLNTELMTF